VTAPAAARVVRLDLAYDGTAYAGWQIQPDVPTVQGALLAAASRVLGEGVKVVGASRTDAGVHALHQVASLTTENPLEAAAVGRALNAMLPPDVRVLRAADAPRAFDARRDARGKRYAYVLDAGAVAAPLLRRHAWHVPGALDVAAMRKAFVSVRGTHDFSAFCAAPGRDAMPVCRLRALHVVEKKSLVVLVVSGDRFLHHMVRNLAGSVVAIGRGTRAPSWLGEVLALRDRRLAAATAPAHGLTLVRVLY
jgi:tRNA pseudouridine38-40 synthase